ncbi:MAG: hypothetical protein V1744_01455 [Candidatus Altiarchaeota archaeon]
MKKTGEPRGQMFSGELLIALVVALAAIILILGLWSSSTREVLETEGFKDMEEAGVDAAEELVRTPGIPSDWGVENVTSLGLANESRILMPHKIRSFIEYMSNDVSTLCSGGMNYECNLHMLGMGGYQFWFNLTYMNGSTVNAEGTPAWTGVRPGSGNNTITIVRTAILEGKVTKMYLTVWR